MMDRIKLRSVEVICYSMIYYLYTIVRCFNYVGSSAELIRTLELELSRVWSVKGVWCLVFVAGEK
jgi:hypothetical protein